MKINNIQFFYGLAINIIIKNKPKYIENEQIKQVIQLNYFIQ